MTEQILAIDGQIKTLLPPPAIFLQAAHDGNEPELMAMAILAHPLSVNLQSQTVSRLYKIGFKGGLPAPTEVRAMREIAGYLLDMEGWS